MGALEQTTDPTLAAPLRGVELAITGRLASMRRDEATRRVAEAGGSYAQTPTETTQVLVVGQGDDAVADVARRQDAELASQTTRGATVVAHRDDRGEIADLVADVTLEATQQDGQAGAAADRDEIGLHHSNIVRQRPAGRPCRAFGPC